MADKNDAAQRFAETAGAFCRLVEDYRLYGTESKRWLAELGKVFLTLDAELRSLQIRPVQVDYSMLQNLEERFVLYQQLKAFLGTYDEYWSEGDLEASDGIKTGSLAGDVADIYFDLKRGLVQYESGSDAQQQALDLWLYSYRVHWRQHLKDATKQLFVFRRAS